MNEIKRVRLSLAIVMALCFVVGPLRGVSRAETVTVIAGGALDVPEIFTIEFYTQEPNKYLYTTNIPFTDMDPTKTWVVADGRAEGDGKNDLGLLCKTNFGQEWYLKIKGSPNDFFLSKVKYGFWRPWNMKLGQPANGTLSEGWYPLPAVVTTIYTAGNNDLNNLGNEAWQQGTLCGFSFAIDPSRLDPKQTYQCAVQFTMTTIM